MAEIPPSHAEQKPPDGFFNELCAMLGLFDGARPVSPKSVWYDEVKPTIEALKENNPQAGVLIRENERVYGLWRDTLSRQVEEFRRADGFLTRWHEAQADKEAQKTRAEQAEAHAAALADRLTRLETTIGNLKAFSEEEKELARASKNSESYQFYGGYLAVLQLLTDTFALPQDGEAR